MRKPAMWFLGKPSCTCTAKARRWKLWIQKVNELYYPCCEYNLGADQLCSYCTADLRLCFRMCKLFFFHNAAQMKMDSLNNSGVQFLRQDQGHGPVLSLVIWGI